MTKRERFPMSPRAAEPDSAGGRGMSFDEMVAALCRVLRKYPGALAEVEEFLLGMAKQEGLGRDESG